MAAYRPDLVAIRDRSDDYIELGDGIVVRRLKHAGAAGENFRRRFAGPMVDLIIAMWEAQTYLLPLEGISHVETVHKFSGYAGDTFEAFESAMIQSLEAGATKNDKGFDAGLAAGGAATTADLVVTSIGGHVVISDDLDNNNFRPVRMTLFGTGEDQDYIIHRKPGYTLLRFIALHATNAKGGGDVTARDDLGLSIADGAVVANCGLRAGAFAFMSSINNRELKV
jgi:hypothetical protein